MTKITVYRALLWLYPSEFRQQFSEEMVSVFEQRAGERFADKRTVSFAFFLTEFSAIVKGANTMWFSKILNPDRKPSKLSATKPTVVDADEGIKLRQHAIQRMVVAIADHDFVTARHYSDEEVRLRHAIEDLRGAPIAPLKFTSSA